MPLSRAVPGGRDQMQAPPLDPCRISGAGGSGGRLVGLSHGLVGGLGGIATGLHWRGSGVEMPFEWLTLNEMRPVRRWFGAHRLIVMQN